MVRASRGVSASLVAGVAANARYVVRDPRWLRSFGEALGIVGGGIGIAINLVSLFSDSRSRS